MKRLVMIFAFALACLLPLRAGEIDASASLDTTRGLIGDRINLRLKAEFDRNIRPVWPAVPDTLGKIEIIGRGKIDTARNGNRLTLTQNFSITAFDSGTYEIPEFTFLYEKNGMQGLLSCVTRPMLISFATMKVDTAKPIKDIKGPWEPPAEWLALLLWLLAAAALVAGGYYAYRYLGKRKMVRSAATDFDPAIPPHIFAIQSLKALESEKLWQNGRYKEYHSRLTDILRLYIRRVYDFNAPEMTTIELIDRFRLTGKARATGMLESILAISDMAKFAKYMPLPDENMACIRQAFAFIEETAPRTAEGREG